VRGEAIALVQLKVLKRVAVRSLQQRVLKDRDALRLGKWVPAVQAELLTRTAARANLNDRVLGRAFLASEAQHIRHHSTLFKTDLGAEL
jgi:hypothetical protein